MFFIYLILGGVWRRPGIRRGSG